VTSTIRIVQISDCHVSADLGREYRGINPHRNLKNLMQKVKAKKPDLLLATGDLSEDGSRESYRLLKKYLGIAGVPVLALPGNHDEPDLLADVFPGSPVDSIAVSEHGPWQIIRLNSCVPGRPEGHLTDEALTALETLLSTDKQRPRLISVHHQPIPVANPWIDKYPLDNPSRLLQLIDETPGVKIVLWGHIHHSFATELGGTAMLGSPSSAINSLAAVKRFTADPAGPACRWLQLNSDHTFLTGITPT
jgi:Icc protein